MRLVCCIPYKYNFRSLTMSFFTSVFFFSFLLKLYWLLLCVCVCVYVLCYMPRLCVYMIEHACHCCVFLRLSSLIGCSSFYRLWKASLFRVSCTSGSTLFSATSSVGPRLCAPSTSFTTWPTRASSTSTASPPTPCCARYTDAVTSLLYRHTVLQTTLAF